MGDSAISAAPARAMKPTGAHAPSRRDGRDHFVFSFSFLLAVCILLGASGQARAVTFGDVVVALEPFTPFFGQYGYAEYMVSVTNKSAEVSHEVKLAFPKDWRDGGEKGLGVTRTVAIGPRSTVRVSLYLPNLPCGGADVEVAIDGKTHDRAIPLTLHSRGSGGRIGEGPFVLLSRNVVPGLEDKIREHLAREEVKAVEAAAEQRRIEDEAFLKEHHIRRPPEDEDEDGEIGFADWSLPKGKAPDPLPKGMAEAQWVRAESAVAAWSTSWLGYSSFDAVMVTGPDVASMPAAVRTALWQYVECGGTLVILGKARVPDTWEQGDPAAAGRRLHHGGFGQCLVCDQPPTELWRDVQIGGLVMGPRGALGHTRSIFEANRLFPVVENLAVPIRGLFLVIIVFAVVIGPLNIYLLTWKKRRIWLLWTVPALSFLTCVLVLGFTVWSEGWNGHSRTEGLTILDETAHRATTIGWAGFYSPITPEDGLRFDSTTELTLQDGREYGMEEYGRRRGRVGPSRAMSWTHGQHLASGWVAARMPTYFALRKSETRRERLTTRRGSDGTVRVVNGLGARIEMLRLADSAGRVYSASDIAAGDEADLALEPPTARAAAKPDFLSTVFAGEWWNYRRTWAGGPVLYLRPGCYIAALDSSPFIEDALKDSSRTGGSVVYGIMRKPVR